ncbi:hypothetical protein [Rhodopseudomonas palustris]|uniref:Uncharacterized protein n=1 Tax=Rhodopseudomonas palustris TaxID=1076 RepID=A0A418V466_RHOPL|nr:hypothetical protein [Rhodopseudomonas palustris]RJF70901.1 hypothetical protein D4Q52_14830 [Rhodopseudomonas palustris]
MIRQSPRGEPCITVTVPLLWLKIWNAMLQVCDGPSRTFSTDDICRETGAPRDAVDVTLRRLIAGGIIVRLTRDGQKFRIASAGDQLPQALWPELQQLWNAMRAMKTFTLDELVFAATTDDLAIGLPVARRYVDLLVGAGYLHANARRVGPDSDVVYRLLPIKNTGALAPVEMQIRLPAAILFDRNLGQAGPVAAMGVLP